MTTTTSYAMLPIAVLTERGRVLKIGRFPVPPAICPPSTPADGTLWEPSTKGGVHLGLRTGAPKDGLIPRDGDRSPVAVFEMMSPPFQLHAAAGAPAAALSFP